MIRECDALVEALKHYADKMAWKHYVPDSHSGLCWEFDWDGDLADEPWEIAQKALDDLEKDGG